MLTSKITIKGQATIPKAIRKNLDLKPNDQVEYINNYQNHTCTIRKAPSHHRNFFDRKCFNSQTVKNFFKEIKMQPGQSNFGREGWPK